MLIYGYTENQASNPILKTIFTMLKKSNYYAERIASIMDATLERS